MRWTRSEGSVRFRLALKGSIVSNGAKGSKASLYGLSRLGEAREAGTITLVEGESDCHTLWHSGFPAIGLPATPPGTRRGTLRSSCRDRHDLHRHRARRQWHAGAVVDRKVEESEDQGQVRPA